MIRLLKFLTSLKLTVACLAVSMVLVFLSTLAQVKLGIYEAQEQYFATWFVWFPLGTTGVSLPLLPGGYLVGGVLILNLLAAHAKRFQLSFKKAGLNMVHLGILILLGGGFVTHWLADEGQLRFDEGETKTFYESFLDRELVVSEALPGGLVRETAFPVDDLKPGQTLTGTFPFALNITELLPNTRITLRRSMEGEQAPVSRGWGQRLQVEEVRKTFKMDEQNLITAITEIYYDGDSLGTWLFTNAITDPQVIRVEGREFHVKMRRTRTYMPFALTLKDFTHDRYPGTDIPKNFSSRVEVSGPEKGAEREVLIYMNNPLRYEGKTFFQQGFDNNDTTSILQVVKNPGWLLPYISSSLVGLGLLWHFVRHLMNHLSRRRAA